MIRPVGRFEIGRHWWRLLTVVIDGLSLNGFVAIKRGFLAKSPLLLANWNCRRTARRPDSRLTNDRDVYVEGQNSFRLRGQSATLAGRPDLMVVHGDGALIVDVKTGRKQPWHSVQVMIYMYALPRALSQYGD